MDYPKKFIDDCKEIYPEWKQLHAALDNGSEIAGRLLNDASMGTGINNQEILKATTLGDLRRIKEKLTLHIAKETLYSQWLALYQNKNITPSGEKG